MALVRKIFLPSLFLLTVLGCNSSHMPPSNFIGIFDYYNGVKNGKLAKPGSDYSGYWKCSNLNDSKTAIDGYYENGHPQGVWRTYYPMGQIWTQILYDGEGHFLELVYYPVGILRSISKGEYCFKGESATKETQQIIKFDFQGKNVDDSSTLKLPAYGWRWTEKEYSDLINESGYYLLNSRYIYYYLVIRKDNTFSLACYTFPRTQTDFIFSKTIVSGELLKEGQLKLDDVIQCLGNEEMTLSSRIEGNKIYFVFTFQNNDMKFSIPFDKSIEMVTGTGGK